MKGRKKSQGVKKDTGRHGRDHSYEGDKGLGEVPARTQRDPHYGAAGAVDRLTSRTRRRRG